MSSLHNIGSVKLEILVVKRKKISSKFKIVQLVFIFFVLITIMIVTNLTSIINCETEDSLPNTSDWHIENANLVSQITWEKALTAQDNLVASSGETVVFHRGNSSSHCEKENKVIALNSTTGDEVWDYSVSLIGGIYPISKGYLVTICCTTIVRLDEHGKEVWQSETVPVKPFEARLFVTGKGIYFPTISKIFQISLQYGVAIQTIQDKSLFAIFDDLIVFNEGGGYLKALDPLNQHTLWTLQLDPFTLSSYYVYHSNNVLLIVLNTHRIQAYDVRTGDVLWTAKKEFRAVPILIDKNNITYDKDNNLNIYDARTGNEIVRIILKHSEKHKLEPKTNTIELPAQLAASGNKVFILDPSTSNLIALSIDAP